MKRLCLAIAAALALSGVAAADEQRENAFADRGFVGTRADPLIKAADGRTIWDLRGWDFLEGPPAPTVDPDFWRHNQRLRKNGLFKVADGIYQVRGFDAANVTFIEGRTGYIVMDPLTSAETAKAAYDLVKDKLGNKPVRAMIYTHSHVDHFGGSRGILPDGGQGKIPVIAPAGFLEAAVSENVLAGNAMSRRSFFQFGSFLPRSPTGQISSGLGIGLSPGTQTLVPPTRLITRTGETLTIDGVKLEFQLTPGTEAPSEMNLFLPDKRALHLSENANASMHNLLPVRGALVRDAKAWADYLTEAEVRYGRRTDVIFNSHAWPHWGPPALEYLAKHRDAYKFLHDQTVRLMNKGYTGVEIAERLKLPEVLAREPYNKSFYGDFSLNTKAVYQRYMGWYDGNPANLRALPPEELATRYVRALGGPRAVLRMAQEAAGRDDRWAVELLNRLVFAHPDNAEAKELLASVYQRMGFAAQSGIIRNVYLNGAQELRRGPPKLPGGAATADIVQNTPTSMFLDLVAVRLDPEKAGSAPLAIGVVATDRPERHLVTLRNSVLLHGPLGAGARTDATLEGPRGQLIAVLSGQPLAEALAAGRLKLTGDRAAVERLLASLDRFTPDFPVVTP